ncbi:hypothetical protein LOK49_LG04G00735 [Camellia lanceoleosa]|uniref:Uncharacterized protein n=1 Tax=Camellia lanceoleosa TaxID=1840588 RepID=A0ACC0I6G0_9ERIC|nr:hypothetical protein LOK49_LG04G00735 [Camellia lanceoleosa]
MFFNTDKGFYSGVCFFLVFHICLQVQTSESWGVFLAQFSWENGGLSFKPSNHLLLKPPKSKTHLVELAMDLMESQTDPRAIYDTKMVVLKV